MSDAAIFLLVFCGIFILRIIAATLVFLWLLPESDRCPNCDAVTLRVQSPGWNQLMPWFRTSWCYTCGWEGLLRFPPPPSLPGAVLPSAADDKGGLGSDQHIGLDKRTGGP